MAAVEHAYRYGAASTVDASDSGAGILLATSGGCTSSGPATEPIAQASEKLNDFLDEIRKRKRRPNSEEEPIVLVEAEPERRPAPKPPIRRDKPAPRITQPSPWAPTAPVVPQAPAKSATDASSLMGSAGVVERRKAIPAITDALVLLAHRQSLATAFILREILDDPISKRRQSRTK